MDPISIAASVAAFVQITDRVVGLCKFYIQSIRDAPHTLRMILIETASLQSVLQSLEYLLAVDAEFLSQAARNLWCRDGTVHACRESLAQLEQLLSDQTPNNGGTDTKKKGNKRQKISQVAIALAWPLKESKASKLLQEVSRHKSTIMLALSTESSHDIKEVRIGMITVQETLLSSEQRTFCEWLEVTNPSELHLKTSDLHEKNTGLWVLNMPCWKDWIAGRLRCLWVHGIPGAGKTVLASFLIQNIPIDPKQPERATSIYYYCYFGHGQDETIPLLRWVVSQLCRQSRTIPQNLFSIYNGGSLPSIQELLDNLADLLKFFSCVYIVVDALDESLEPRDQLLNVLRLIATEPRFRKIQLLSTSREYFDIESAMSSFSVSLAMQVDQVQADIWKYVCTTLREQRRFSSWPEELRREVQDVLAVGAKGMFRWAVCQIDVLRRLTSISDVRRALTSLPETLDDTYERIFSMIPVDERHIVFRVLCILCGHDRNGGSNNPMDTRVLLSIVADDWDCTQDKLQKDGLCDIDVLAEACGCLVTMSSRNEDMASISVLPAKLAHFTVQEYLYSERPRASETSAIRSFALSADTVNRVFLQTMLRGIVHYVGQWAQFPDSICDLYDYALFFGFYAIQRHFERLLEWQLCSVALEVLEPNGQHVKRLSEITKLDPGQQKQVHIMYEDLASGRTVPSAVVWAWARARS